MSIDHTKDNLLESMNLKNEDYEKITDSLKLLYENKPLHEVINDIENKNIEKTIYYISLFIFTFIIESSKNCYSKNLLELSNKQISEKDIGQALNILTAFIQNSDITSDATKVSLILVPIILMAATKIIPLSLCIETLVQSFNFNKLTLNDIFNGTASLGEFLDPILFNNITHIKQ